MSADPQTVAHEERAAKTARQQRRQLVRRSHAIGQHLTQALEHLGDLLAEERLPFTDRPDERNTRCRCQEIGVADGLANRVGPKVGRIQVQDAETAFARYLRVANHRPDGRHHGTDLVDREAGVGVSVDSEIHHSLLTLHGPVTRHVTGALLTARQWLQRRAWVRRAASARPSGTTSQTEASA